MISCQTLFYFIKWKIGVNCFIFKTILHWIWGHILKHREKAFRKFSGITDVFRTLLNILDGAFCENTVNNYEPLTIFTKHCNRDVCKGLRGLWISDLKSKSKIWKEHFWKDITVSAPLHFLLGRYHFQSQILKRGGDQKKMSVFLSSCHRFLPGGTYYVSCQKNFQK